MSAPYQLFDELPSYIEEALTESIRQFGVLVPVTLDQHGNILDGHHRSRIAGQLGVDYSTNTVTISSEEEGREIARTLNADRRHLTREQRKEIVAHLRSEGHSQRAIAEAVGVSQPTIKRDVDELIQMNQLDSPKTVVGRSGRSYPATRPAAKDVTHLRSEGHSTTAIAEATGSSQSTVDGDIKQPTRVGNLTSPPETLGMDGKRYPAKRPAPEPAEAVGSEETTVRRDIDQLRHMSQFEEPDRVKSLDGKSRPATRPASEPVEPEQESPPAISGMQEPAPAYVNEGQTMHYEGPITPDFIGDPPVPEPEPEPASKAVFSPSIPDPRESAYRTLKVALAGFYDTVTPEEFAEFRRPIIGRFDLSELRYAARCMTAIVTIAEEGGGDHETDVQ